MKEVPYLVLMIAGALNQVPAREHLAVARALGYSRAEAWVKVVLPQVYPQIRLPVYAVIAFSLSVVDVALILGPTNPPTLAVLAVRWFTDADIGFYYQAAAAATLLLALVAVVVAAWYGMERVAIGAGRRWIARGRRGGAVDGGRRGRGGRVLRRVRRVGVRARRHGPVVGRRAVALSRTRCRTRGRSPTGRAGWTASRVPR